MKPLLTGIIVLIGLGVFWLHSQPSDGQSTLSAVEASPKTSDNITPPESDSQTSPLADYLPDDVFSEAMEIKTKIESLQSDLQGKVEIGTEKYTETKAEIEALQSQLQKLQETAQSLQQTVIDVTSFFQSP